MIFDINDKTVEVKIPETVPKLKNAHIMRLYDNFESEEIFEELKRYEKSDHYDKKVETIGIWMSGGADSSLLTYVLAKKIKDENLTC